MRLDKKVMRFTKTLIPPPRYDPPKPSLYTRIKKLIKKVINNGF